MTAEVKATMFEIHGNLLNYTLEVGLDKEQVIPPEITDVISPWQLERVTLLHGRFNENCSRALLTEMSKGFVYSF